MTPKTFERDVPPLNKYTHFELVDRKDLREYPADPKILLNKRFRQALPIRGFGEDLGACRGGKLSDLVQIAFSAIFFAVS